MPGLSGGGAAATVPPVSGGEKRWRVPPKPQSGVVHAKDSFSLLTYNDVGETRSSHLEDAEHFQTTEN